MESYWPMHARGKMWEIDGVSTWRRAIRQQRCIVITGIMVKWHKIRHPRVFFLRLLQSD